MKERQIFIGIVRLLMLLCGLVSIIVISFYARSQDTTCGRCRISAALGIDRLGGSTYCHRNTSNVRAGY